MDVGEGQKEENRHSCHFKYIINADGAELKPSGSVAELDWGAQRGGKADLILSYQQVISKAKPAKGYSSRNVSLIW